MMQARLLICTLVVAIWAISPTAAQTPKKVKVIKDWAAYSYSGKKGKICYVVSQPKTKSPADRDHGDVFFFITHRPGEGVRNEASVVVGYPFASKSKVTINIDGQGFSLFTQGDGAWVENAAQEKALVDAMRKGRQMQISGQSSRGTTTKYSYSLSGITAALNTIGSSCP